MVPELEPEQGATARELALALAEAARANKGEQVCVLDVGSQILLCDYFLIVTVTNMRQSVSMLRKLDEAARAVGRSKARKEGDGRTAWTLSDYGDVVAHILTPEAREFYALEEFWDDAEVVPLDSEAA